MSKVYFPALAASLLIRVACRNRRPVFGTDDAGNPILNCRVSVLELRAEVLEKVLLACLLNLALEESMRQSGISSVVTIRSVTALLIAFTLAGSVSAQVVVDNGPFVPTVAFDISAFATADDFTVTATTSLVIVSLALAK